MAAEDLPGKETMNYDLVNLGREVLATEKSEVDPFGVFVIVFFVLVVCWKRVKSCFFVFFQTAVHSSVSEWFSSAKPEVLSPAAT